MRNRAFDRQEVHKTPWWNVSARIPCARWTYAFMIHQKDALSNTHSHEINILYLQEFLMLRIFYIVEI